MTQDKKMPELVEVSNHEYKCSLCKFSILRNLDTKRSSKRTKAGQKRKYENLFWDHVRVEHPEAYVSVEKIEVQHD
jgi:hypothetical protein